MTKWLEVDLGAIKDNIKIIKKEICWPKVKLMPVVKANAYGHGLVETAKICQNEKVDYLAVANLEEAFILRQGKITLPILVIGYIDKEQIKDALINDVTFSIYDLKEAAEIKKICQSLNKKAKVHLKVDTGMHRLGFLPDSFINNYKQILEDNCFDIEYIYSHFADIENRNYSNKQLKILSVLLDEIKENGDRLPRVHFCRSASLNWPKTYYDMVRVGLALYGLEKSVPQLTPALTFKTKIVQVKEIQKGDYVGYSLTFRAPKKMKIAPIAVGYADGYSRNLSSCGEVLIKGSLCPVIGRICMNLTIVDVSSVENPQIGDSVVLIGKDGKEEVSVLELARKINTIPYEIVSRIPAEIPRIYKK